MEDLNAIAARVFPSDPTAVSDWWGGVWLGVAASRERIELRLYFNLRHGRPRERWQRAADVLALFGADQVEPALRSTVERAASHTIPVGLGMVIVDGGLPILRLYVGVHAPAPSVLRQLVGAEASSDAGAAVDDLCAAFLAAGGAFAGQSVTVGFDFRRDEDGVLIPGVARTKVDLSCQFLASGARAAIPGVVADIGFRWGFNREPLQRFTEDLETSFNGFDCEYLSASVGPTPSGLTLYVKPHECTDI